MKKLKVYRLSLGWQIILGLLIGIGLGVIFADDKGFIKFANGLGSTFINMISMIVLPIVFSSLVVGIANMGDIKKLGRIGLKTLIYFEVLSTIAFIVGMLVSNLSQIGYMLDLSKLSQ
ncbi:MAG TPA: glutamate/aspartate:proton symporter GltP, partial [Lactobacillus sp.]|nr:glutamate/aspartate:proton symporter GltP [Lactobacillus sp.]